MWTSSNDGPSSNLDADTVDGIEAERIIYGDNSTSKSINITDANSASSSGFYSVTTPYTNCPTAGNYMITTVGRDSNYSFQIAKRASSSDATSRSYIYYRQKSAGTWLGWVQFHGICGSIHSATDQTQNNIFNAISPYLADGGEIAVNGGFSTAAGVWIASRATRSGSTITIYCMDVSGVVSQLSCADNSATVATTNISLSW